MQTILTRSSMLSLVVADPNFDLSGQPAASAPSTAIPEGAGVLSRDLARHTKSFSHLPSTRKEGEEIAALLNAQFLVGDTALEANVKAVHSPYVLHIATHGFFLPDQQSTTEKTYTPIATPAESEFNRLAQITKLQVENPLLR